MFSFGHTRMLMSAALTVWTNNSMLLIVFLVWYVLFSLKAYRLFQWTLLFDHWVTEPTIVTSCNHQDEGWVSFTKEFLCFKHKFANCKCAHNNFQIWTLRAWSKRFSKCWKLCQFVFLSLERQKNKRRCWASHCLLYLNLLLHCKLTHMEVSHSVSGFNTVPERKL